MVADGPRVLLLLLYGACHISVLFLCLLITVLACQPGELPLLVCACLLACASLLICIVALVSA